MRPKTLPSLAAWLWLAFLLLHPGVLPAAAESPRDLATLLASLRQEQPATVAFTESRFLAYLTEPVVVEGELTYRPGGRLERLSTRPKREKMVIEGGLLTLEQNPGDPPIRVLLADHPPLRAFVEALRALLAGDQAALQAAFDGELESDGADWRLALTPKDPALAGAIERIEVAGRDEQLTSFEIRESNGNRTLVALHPQP